MVSHKLTVFISWSGKTSQMVAAALRDWLPQVLQSVTPFMSEHDIAKGSRGQDEIAGKLRDAAMGVICLTPNNVAAPWILFEADALSNSLSERELVCPYLIGLEKKNVPPPLSLFQLAAADEDDTLHLVRSINNAFEPDLRLSDSVVTRQFQKWWPDLEKQIDIALAGYAEENTVPASRDQEEILGEVLEVVRRLERDSWGNQFSGLVQQELPIGFTEAPGPFKIGAKVIHPEFGSGVVRGLSGAGHDLKAVIDFETLGRKKVVVRYANLQLADT